VNSFNFTEKYDKCLSFPRLGGINPVNLFISTEKYDKCLSFLMLGGINPVNLFNGTLKYDNCGILPTEGGIVPLKLFNRILKYCRFVSFPIHYSIVPVRLLASSVSPFNPFNCTILLGTTPDSWFPANIRNARLVMRLPIEYGIAPCRLLLGSKRVFRERQFAKACKNSHPSVSLASSMFTAMSSRRSPESFPKELGIFPINLLFARLTFWSKEALPREAGM
jgi:hypothetical protein